MDTESDRNPEKLWLSTCPIFCKYSILLAARAQQSEPSTTQAESQGGTVDIGLSEVVEITSPNYPDSYNNDDNVVWMITSPENTTIYFEIQESDVSLIRITVDLRIHGGMWTNI